MTPYEGGDDRRGNQSDRRHGWDRESLQIVLAVATLVGLIFTGGYNWRRVDELSTQINRVEGSAVRQDVLQEQFRTMSEQLKAVATQLDDLKESIRQQPRTR